MIEDEIFKLFQKSLDDLIEGGINSPKKEHLMNITEYYLDVIKLQYGEKIHYTMQKCYINTLMILGMID
jgi:hypothetical protein